MAGTVDVRIVTTKFGKAEGKISFTFSGQKSKLLSH
jgi:hypothetical protein